MRVVSIDAFYVTPKWGRNDVVSVYLYSERFARKKSLHVLAKSFFQGCQSIKIETANGKEVLAEIGGAK